MRLAVLAAVLACFAAAPALADDAADLTAAKATIAAAKLSANSDLYMWCGAAMMIVAQVTKDSAPDKSKAATDDANTLFTKASASLTADGVTQDNFGGMMTAYMTLATAQLVTQTDPLSHQTDDCDAAKAK